MNYKNYTDKDLEEAYNTMIEYSGKASDDILSEINNRGGIEVFLSRIEFNKKNKKEIIRITNEVYSMSKDYSDLDFIKQFVKSETINPQELERLIELKFNEHQAILKNNTINRKTIFGSLIGIILGIIFSLFFYFLIIYFFQRFVLYPIVGVYITCYQSIKFTTKQTRDNIFVFISTLVATIITMLCLFLLYRILK